jgi:hypothetical protein
MNANARCLIGTAILRGYKNRTIATQVKKRILYFCNAIKPEVNQA